MALEVLLVGSTEGIKDIGGAKRFCQNDARVCYSEKDWDDLVGEAYNPFLVDKILLYRGHHSPFDHFSMNLYLKGIPKALAMVLNNEGFYTTSEKSARYTQMKDIPDEQRILYNKWKEIFLDKIQERFPNVKSLYDVRGGKTAAEKLAMENARYMTSVFTPTKMAYSVSFRQFNVLLHYFKDFIRENEGGEDEFKSRLASSMKEFVESPVAIEFYVPKLGAKAGKKLSFFGDEVEEYFGRDIYSTNYPASFASLAQLHRYRILDYHVVEGWQKGAPLDFFVPPLIREENLTNEWIKDLESVAEKDFPQAQLVKIAERGKREDLYGKFDERICGLAQLETALRTAHLIKKYAAEFPEMRKFLKPSCLENGCSKGGCHFGPENVLTRLI